MKFTDCNFSCLMCYLEKDDKIINPILDETYTIKDDFKYELESKRYNYTKEELKDPTIDFEDPKRLFYSRKKFLVPTPPIDFRPRITDMIVHFGKNTYDFTQLHNQTKLALKLAKDIQSKYLANSNYRKYVEERLDKLKNYDSLGRKTTMDIKNVGDFKVIKYLSTGLYGATYIVSKKGKEYVMKTFHTKTGKRSPKAVEKECNIAKLAGDLGVGPKVIECQSTGKPQYIVMEKLDGPTVWNKYGDLLNMPESDFKQFQKLKKILDDSHIKHNDLHLGNVMYHKSRLYIIDYGMANIVKNKVKNIIKNVG